MACICERCRTQPQNRHMLKPTRRSKYAPLWMAVSLLGCASQPLPTFSEPRTGQEFISRVSTIVDNEWEIEPQQIARVLATTFQATNIRPLASGRCGKETLGTRYRPSPEFWFRKTLSAGPDRTVPAGSLPARFIPPDPSFSYATFVSNDCLIRGSITFEHVESWMCIPTAYVGTAGYDLGIVMDGGGISSSRKHTNQITGDITVVVFRFRGPCISSVRVDTQF